MIFDENRRIIYPTGWTYYLKDEEWKKIKEGQTVTVNTRQESI